MNKRLNGFLVLALVAVAGVAQANRPAASQVTGVVSAVNGSSITINGTTYEVLPNSPATAEVLQLQPGSTVTLQLNGPPGAAASSVVTIQAPANTNGRPVAKKP